MSRVFVLIVCVCISFQLSSQRTVGLISYKPWSSYDGYNILYPHNQSDVFLLNNCGEIVHKWEGEDGRKPGNTAYILDNGNLVKTHRATDISMDNIWAGGGGETVEIVSWDNASIWSYTLNSETERMHHDITVLPNGNIAMIVWEYKSEEEAIAAGRDTSLITQDALWPDKIVEINPENDEIVWEWHVWDHLVQDYDATKANYDVVADSPSKVNLNFDTNDGKADWMHTNALDFDPINNHIILSVPTFHEMWVIDHSTTTAQAATSNGGISGKGGDLIYRWGNPAAYDNGTADDQKLFYQHDVQVVDDFLLPNHPLFGKYAAFNNRVGEDFSSVVIWDNPYDMYLAEFAKNGDVFAPEDYKISLTHPIPQKLFSSGLSSIQVLPNSNYLITDGRHGYTFELTPDNEIVWEYITPIKGGFPAAQGDSLEINNNLTFRTKRYPVDYPGFTGKVLEGNGFIEIDGDEEFCNQILPIEMTYENDDLKISPNPASNFITIEWETKRYEDIRILDIFGREMMNETVSGGRIFVDISDYTPGYYFVKTSGIGVKKFIVIK